MIYRTVLFKNPDRVLKPPNVSDTDWDTWKNNMASYVSDFETNYKSQVTHIPRTVPYDTEVDYNTFKEKIDGTTVTWDMVRMLDTPDAYYLFVDA